MEKIDLSILICSLLERRKTFLDNLLSILEPQLEGKNVELLIMTDNRKRTIPEKRNHAISGAQGKYFCFVDDDDRVADDYVDSILAEIPKDTDVIVFDALITFNNGISKNVKYGMEYDHCEKSDAYYRRPNPLMVHKRSTVTEKFINVSNEDDEWAKRRLPSITSQSRIDKILYYYDARYC